MALLQCDGMRQESLLVGKPMQERWAELLERSGCSETQGLRFLEERALELVSWGWRKNGLGI